MKQLKKTLLTLVALLALTTQAWAESKPIGLNVEYAAGDVITTNSTGDVYIWWGYYLSGEDIQEGAIKITSSVSPTISMLKISESTGYIRLVDDYSVYDKDGNIIQEDPEIQCQGMVTGTALEKVYVKSGSGTLADPYVFAPGSAPAAASGPEVAWNKTSNTGTFTMPGGNVTLEPEYYPQAALTAAPTAINDVPATTDGAIVKAGTVANIGNTETAQGTVMYYVSPTEMTDEALLALAADQWTADVPTAESLAQGQAYVYYYVRGNDSDTDEENFSDGDILAANALTVTIAAAPTYAVTFADDTAEPTLWTAEPNAGVTKGQTVTVTYTGSKKVIGVKAEKKAAATVTTAPQATTGDIKAGSTTALIEAGVADGGTLMYAVTTTNTKPTSTEGFSADVPTAKTCAAGTVYVWYYVKADADHVDSEIAGPVSVTVAAGTPEYLNKLTKINDDYMDQVHLLKQLGRGRQAYNSSLTAAQAYALATYQAAIDGKAVYVIMSSQDNGYEIHYALSTDAAATEHTADLYNICNESNPVRMYYVAQ